MNPNFDQKEIENGTLQVDSEQDLPEQIQVFIPKGLPSISKKLVNDIVEKEAFSEEINIKESYEADVIAPQYRFTEDKSAYFKLPAIS